MKFFKNIFIFFIFSLICLSVFSINASMEQFIIPTKYTTVSSNYGYRDIFNFTSFHNGIDFLAPEASEVYACANGIVVETGFSSSYGNYIILQHSNNFKSLYGHLSENFIVALGDYVYSNQHIANVGPKYLSNGKLNGITTGPHLHFTIFDENNKTIDPLEVLKKDSTKNTILNI